MRKLQTQDVFKAIRVISLTDFKEGIKKLTEDNIGKEFKAQDLGVDILFDLLEKLSDANAESGIYEFLSGPFEVPPEEIKSMDLLDLVTGLRECADVDGWKAFFKSVSALGTK